MTDVADELYERVLVIRCRAGDEAAFAELVERYQPRLRYFVRQMLRQPQLDDDVLQDVWLNVFRGVPRLADVSAFRAWIYRIAHDRACYEHRRRKPFHQTLQEVDLVDEGINEAIFSADNAEYIHAALEELETAYREVLVLRFLEDMSYEDVALVIGCPVGTVRSRIHYAKRALRRALERMNCDAR
jgi:RNA polymerase sigma-70 factor, ECF subfamily